MTASAATLGRGTLQKRLNLSGEGRTQLILALGLFAIALGKGRAGAGASTQEKAGTKEDLNRGSHHALQPLCGRKEKKNRWLGALGLSVPRPSRATMRPIIGTIRAGLYAQASRSKCL